MKKGKWLLILLLMILVVAIWIARHGTAEESPPGKTGVEAASPSATFHRDPEQPSKAPVQPSVIVPRPLPEIRKSLLEQGREVIDKNLGGVDATMKEDLTRRIAELENFVAGGLGHNHPASLIDLLNLADFSRKLDSMAAYDEAGWRKEAALYLGKRLAEVEAMEQGASPAGLRERWWREFSRDDVPEAILLRNLDHAESPQEMSNALLRLIRLVEPASK